VQGVTDGHKAIIGHHSQDEVVQPRKKQEKVHLCDTVFIANCFAASLDVHQQLWDSGGGKGDVYKGQIGEEEVHGCVQVWVCDCGQDDEQVPKHSDQVHEEEKSKDEWLPFWVF
jgi:hypothetical protein